MLHVVDQIQSSRTPEEVTAQFDLTLGEVHTALAYYHEHPEKVHELCGKIAERVREHRRKAITGLDEPVVGLRLNSKSQTD